MENVNEIFQQFAAAFTGDIESWGLSGEIAFPQKLDRARLDYSLGSLEAMDRYLDYVHGHKDQLTEDEWNRTVLRSGAYLGEVVRRNGKSARDWVDYNEYMPRHPDLQPLIPDRNPATCAFLCREAGMWMPLSKVARYIEEGPEQNTHYSASLECAR